MNKIIAVVGMCGSGKSIASEYYENLGFNNIYFGEVTMIKLKEANLEVTPENEKMMREKLRIDYGMAAFAIFSLPKIEEHIKNNNVVLDGLYSWEELKFLKEKFCEQLKVISIIADKEKRYDRLANRTVRPFNAEQAKIRDISEIENLSKAGPIAYADYYILNNGNLKDYQSNLDKVTEMIYKEEK